MTLIEKLDKISNQRVKILNEGKTDSIEEFWKEVVEPTLPSKDVVLLWHKLIMSYVNEQKPCFAIRGYNNASPERYCDLRRGFLTETISFSFFYTDNFFAAYFLKMVIDGFVPTLEELRSAFAQRKFPSRFGRNTSEERELLAIPQGKDPAINSAGYKLAHIIPVGKEYCYNGKIMGSKKILDLYFPRGKRSDWTLHNDVFCDYYARDFVADKSAFVYARAHFLRFIHPFNYFLCPKKKCEVNNKCNEIAEYQPLLDYAHDYMLRTFGNDYIEYLKLVMPLDEYDKPRYDDFYSSIEVCYGLDIDKDEAVPAFGLAEIKKAIKKMQARLDVLKRSATDPKTFARAMEVQKKLDELKRKADGDILTEPVSIRTTSDSHKTARKYDEDLELRMAMEYLSNSKTSFRKLELKFLQINSAARGGGFIAKEIINRLGITSNNKGILETMAIDDLICKSTGVFLSTLKTIKGRMLI